MSDLPHCDELHLKFFDRWYSSEDRQRRLYKATRPDLEELISCPARSLSSDDKRTIEKQVAGMLAAAREDWPRYLEVTEPISKHWINAFDRHYDERAVRGVLERSDPNDFSNDYVIICCELGAVLGEIFLSTRSGFAWEYDSPYWESAIINQKKTHRVNVFHWAIKKMSGYGAADKLEEKIELALQVLEGKPQ